jgi:hypothetical protein
MIGVAARGADLETAAEFFELFKTPWEPIVAGRAYPVVLSTVGRPKSCGARVLLLFGSALDQADVPVGMNIDTLDGPLDAEINGERLPLYGRVTRFLGTHGGAYTVRGKALDVRKQCGDQTIWHIGYDLFAEVSYLLRTGQPVRHAATPTLDRHIAGLRRLLLAAGVPFVEIPPRPSGFDFACCLTHDIDFFGIRRHAFDRTLAGFAARASVGTLADLVRGRRPWSEAVHNWKTLCSLPLVMLRMMPDIWRPFDDYARADQGLPSTFFLVPTKRQPGISPEGAVNPARAVAYEVAEITAEIGAMVARGSEAAVHGIDAWRDTDAGRDEISRLTNVTGQHRAGVRMHWLYFADSSPQHLEHAGFDYDSTCGYNDAVGYRAGTSQVFRLPGTRRLMELPLTIMDSAMFFGDRMGLSREEGLARCRDIVVNASRDGGTVVINWHDRSLVPERQWGLAYAKLLDEVRRGHRPWFATAREAVDWFRWRRAISFTIDGSGVNVSAVSKQETLPGATVQVHRPGRDRPEEQSLNGNTPMTVRP